MEKDVKSPGCADALGNEDKQGVVECLPNNSEEADVFSRIIFLDLATASSSPTPECNDCNPKVSRIASNGIGISCAVYSRCPDRRCSSFSVASNISHEELPTIPTHFIGDYTHCAERESVVRDSSYIRELSKISGEKDKPVGDGSVITSTAIGSSVSTCEISEAGYNAVDDGEKRHRLPCKCSWFSFLSRADTSEPSAIGGFILALLSLILTVLIYVCLPILLEASFYDSKRCSVVSEQFDKILGYIPDERRRRGVIYGYLYADHASSLWFIACDVGYLICSLIFIWRIIRMGKSLRLAVSCRLMSCLTLSVFITLCISLFSLESIPFYLPRLVCCNLGPSHIVRAFFGLPIHQLLLGVPSYHMNILWTMAFFWVVYTRKSPCATAAMVSGILTLMVYELILGMTTAASWICSGVIAILVALIYHICLDSAVEQMVNMWLVNNCRSVDCGYNVRPIGDKTDGRGKRKRQSRHISRINNFLKDISSFRYTGISTVNAWGISRLLEKMECLGTRLYSVLDKNVSGFYGPGMIGYYKWKTPQDIIIDDDTYICLQNAIRDSYMGNLKIELKDFGVNRREQNVSKDKDLEKNGGVSSTSV